MKALYNISILFFKSVLSIVAPFHSKARMMVAGRENWENKIREANLEGKVAWFHCASLGEFEQGRPIIEEVKNKYPEWKIVVTFFSPSGYEVRKNYEQADLVLYLPFDLPSYTKHFIHLVNPGIAVFVKYEFWNNFLIELQSKKIPTFLVSGIFRKEQLFFKRRGAFFRKMLGRFNYFFVQNETSKELLNALGIENVTNAGDTRFDRVKEICHQPKQIELAKKFKSNHQVMVVGSSWPEDMEVLLPYINEDTKQLKFIIAPHEIEKSKILKLKQSIKVSTQLYSEADNDTIVNAKVLIIDNIGLLSSLYQYGDLAYIGGAFGDGLHNILEAATFGLPILFGKGKDNHKYQEAVDLVNQGGAFEVSTKDDVSKIAGELLSENSKLSRASKIAFQYVQDHSGATNTVMKYLEKYLS